MVRKKKSVRRKLADPKATAPGIFAPTQRPNPNLPQSPSGQIPTAKTPWPAASGAVGDYAVPMPSENEATAFDSAPSMLLKSIGNSGTQIFGGYFSEDYLRNLSGRQGAKKWDEMRRSEAQVAMLLNAVMNPIKSANWSFEPYQQEPEFQKHAELIEMCIKEMIDFNTFIHEALTVVPFGFSIFEIVHSVVENHPTFGTFNGLKAISFRSQKTIENWQLEPKTGRLIGVNQYTYSDLGGNEFIPGEFLLVITHSKEGDNYEGISALRSCYGAYIRKELYLKLAAIGLERYAIGTPIGTVPKGKEKTSEFEEFKKILENYTSHETSFITKPEGWTIEIQKGEFDAQKVKEMLVFENTEMANAFVANFLVLGMNGGGGAYALGSNLGEFFTTGIQSYADLVSDAVNRVLIPNIVKLNFGEQPGYPKMKCSGISDKAGKEFAETIKLLTDARAIDPDMPLKEFIRKQYKMPAPDPTTAVELPLIPAGGSQNYAKPGAEVVNPVTDKVSTLAEVKLAEKAYVKDFDKKKANLKSLMQSNLTQMYSQLKDVLRTKYNGLSGSDKILTAKNVDIPGIQNYKGVLRDYLSECAAKSIDAARKQVPKKKNVKLSEYDALPPAVRKLIDAQASLVAETQASDIEKMVFFQFTSSATSSDDVDAILFDVDNKVLPTLEGSTAQGMSIDVAAADALAHVVQQSALEFYFAPDVIDGIESFTFTNEDPVSDICTELAGQTFAVDDPDLDKYSPPLHHNCKSRLVPNPVGSEDNPEIDREGVSLSKQALKSMTLCEPGCGVRLSEEDDDSEDDDQTGANENGDQRNPPNPRRDQVRPRIPDGPLN